METYITSLLGTKSLCLHRWDFLMQMFASPNIVATAQGIVLFTLKNKEYCIILFYQRNI